MVRFTALTVFIFFVWANFPGSASADQWFDSYGKISWGEEKSRLDNFALYLKQNPDMNGYIGYWTGPSDRSARVRSSDVRARNYLVRDRRIERDRIIVVDVGRKDETQFVLQPVNKNLGSPFSARGVRKQEIYLIPFASFASSLVKLTFSDHERLISRKARGVRKEEIC